MKLKTFSMGGVHPEENKITAEVATVVAPLPQQAIFPLSQHIGAPAVPVVKIGDKVECGQVVAKAAEGLSVNIHASISGIVTGVTPKCITVKKVD